MHRALLALLLTASVAVIAQDAKTKVKAAPPAPVAKSATAAPAAKPASGIVANKDSKTFHRADCKAAAKIKDANKTTFASAAEATKAGFKACKICKP